ncbi:MAG: lycopene cyclase domain-containing protein [Anaerolineaceae bacterium]|nr:lycopene cyclase domain-containing protein [Anaerolineaceae bacterium]
MTYFGFLGVFLIVPLAVLLLLHFFDTKSKLMLPASWQSWSSWKVISVQALIAVIYTTPWDNYLVATRTWWYNPGLVTGFLIGYVPIEEYTFFVLQTFLTGTFLLLLVRHRPLWGERETVGNANWRWLVTGFLAILWLFFVVMLIVGWKQGTYLALLMVWALPPLMLQTAFGLDILWKYRRYVVVTVVSMTIYLAAADMLAISSGTWTIDPEQSLNIFLLGKLPIEEFIFFLMTNVLVVVGVTLLSSTISRERIINIWQAIKLRRKEVDRHYEASS